MGRRRVNDVGHRDAGPMRRHCRRIVADRRLAGRRADRRRVPRTARARGRRQTAAADAASADVDHRRFPDVATRRADRRRQGQRSASATLLGRGRADPRRRRDGHDAVRERPPVRRSARGLEPDPARRHPAHPARLPRGRVADHHDQHVRWQPARGSGCTAMPTRVDELNRTAAILARAEVDAAGGTRARGRRHRAAAARSSQPLGTLDYDDRGRRLPRAGGLARRRRRRPHLDRDDVRSQRDQGRHRGRPPGLARASRSSPR